MNQRQNEKRDALISAVIRLVSREGLESLTTKGIEKESGISERYIFLYFGTKEGLLVQTFDSLDLELYSLFVTALKKAIADEPRKEQCLHKAWVDIWNTITGDMDKTRFFIRYYYSEQFERLSRKSHEKNSEEFGKLVAPMFTAKSNAEDCRRYVFTSLLSAALASSRSTPDENKRSCERTFRYLYDSMKNHLA